MNIEEYRNIKKSLRNFGDFKKYSYPRGTLYGILLQKKVDWVKRNYWKYAERLPEIANYWEKYKRIPDWLHLPPVLRVKFLLKSLGFTKKEISKNFSNPEDSEFGDLIWKAIYRDFIYSPIAVKNQFARGRVGENIVRDYLENNGIEYKDEKQLRPAKKTPDFWIEEGIEVNGRKIRWIESKALFGDLKTHMFYTKKQFNPYLELYGDGAVIYWLGKIDGLNSLSLVFDHRFIENKSKAFLVEMKIFMAHKCEEEVAEKVDGDVFEWRAGDESYSNEFLSEFLRLFSSVERNIVIAGGNRTLKSILRNFGFEVVTML